MRIGIDTDIGTDVDDALTLAYVVRHPGFELVGVSTVFGDVELRTRICAELLEKGGASGVPVVSGLGKPPTQHRKGIVFGHEGIGLLQDPVTAAVLVEPSICPFEPRRIVVEDSGASKHEEGPANLLAATGVDNQRLCRNLMETWPAA